jgi:DNA-binding protein HU-beta
MNTADLIERVAAEHGVAKDHARRIIDSTFAAITAAAVSGEEIALAGFGRFKVADKPERQGRNPATGEAITIAAARKLSFSPAKPLRDALNQTPTKNVAQAAR